MSFVPDRPETALPSIPMPLPEEAAHSYWRAVTRRWPLVVLVTALTIGAAAFTVGRLGHRYQASASVLVNPLPNSVSVFQGSGAVIDTADPARTVQTAAALIQSPQAAAQAAAKMGPGWSAGRVEGATSVTPRGQSNVLAVTATAPTGKQAARLANLYANAALAVRSRVVQANIANELNALRARKLSATGTPTSAGQSLNDLIAQLQTVQDTGRDPSLSILAAAQVPGSPAGASWWLIILLAALAGFALGCVAAVAIEYFSRRVRDAHDVRAIFQEPILAGIPMVGRRRRLPMFGRDHEALSPLELPPQAFEQLRLLKAQLLAPAYGRVIMVTSADAGDGKTTVAAALASAFGEGGNDVILLDADVIKPDAARVLGLPEPSLGAEGVDGKMPLADLLVSLPELPHVKVLRAQWGDMLALDALTARLPELLHKATQLADRVILDTPPVGEVSLSIRLAAACDSVVVVVRPRHTDRARLSLTRDKLLRVGANLAGTVLVGESVVRLSGAGYGYGYGYGHGYGAGAQQQTSDRDSVGQATDDSVGQRTPDKSGAGQRTPDKSGAGQRTPDKSGAGQRTPDKSGAGQRTPDTSGAGQRTPDTSGAGQRTPEDNTAVTPQTRVASLEQP